MNLNKMTRAGLISIGNSIARVVHKVMGWDLTKVNVSGGAIELGHPIGASSCRIFVTLLYEMQRQGVGKGLAARCIGGGMGAAMAVGRV